jgi:hypothetical protein
MHRRFRILLAVILSSALQLSRAAGAPVTAADCDSSPSNAKIEREDLIGDYVHSNDKLAFRVTSNDADYKNAKFQFIVDGQRGLVIGPEEIKGFKQEGTILHMSVTVAVTDAGQQPGQLTLRTGKQIDVYVLAYSVHGADPTLRCGRNSTPFTLTTLSRGPFAIVMGFNYPNSGYELEFAQSDAQAVALHLKNHANVAAQHIYLFTDDPKAKSASILSGMQVIFQGGTNPVDTIRQITTTFDTVYGEADTGAVVYFYFSGHGYASPPDQLNKYSDTHYLLVPGSDTYTPGTLYPRKELYASLLVNSQAAGRYLKAIGIFDACYSGPAAGDLGKPTGEKKIPGMFVSRPRDEPSISSTPAALIWSSGSFESSWEFEKTGDITVKHGYFTYNLLRAANDALASGKSLSLNEAANSAINMTAGYVPDDKDIRSKYKESPNWSGHHDALTQPWVLQ